MYWIGPTQVVVNSTVKVTAMVVLSITIHVTYHNCIMTVGDGRKGRVGEVNVDHSARGQPPSAMYRMPM